MAAREHDPALGYMFMVDVRGFKGYFTSISGMGSEHAVAKQKVVNEKGQEMEIKMPGRLEWGDITLKRGLTGSIDLWAWRDDVVHGEIGKARTDCTITLLTRDYQPVTSWHLVNAWPSKMSGISISTDSNDFVMEELVISHEGITREGAEGYPAIPPKS